MDIVSFLSTQVPAYYAVIPIVTLIIVLITLIVKPAPSATAPAQAEVKTPSNPYMASFQPSSVPQQTQAPAQTSAPAVTPPSAPEVAQKPEGTVPPISAWKPKEVAQTIPQEPVVVTPETPQGTVAVAETQAQVATPTPTPTPTEAPTSDAVTVEEQPKTA